MKTQLVIKRDEHGQNRFLKLAEFYKKCKDKFECKQNGFHQFKEKLKLMGDQKYQDRHLEQMKFIKAPKTTLVKLIESTEKCANLLQTSKLESRKENHDMYFYHSYYIIDYFCKNFLQEEVNVEKNNKQDIILQSLFVIFLKNSGHFLPYDLFLGWAVYYSQLFVIPQQDLKGEDIPLLVQAGSRRSTYYELFKQVSLMFSSLICINPMNLLQFIRSVTKQDLQYYQLQSSYKNIINFDLEQIDYFWHFIDKFSRHSSQHINHTNVIIFSNFLEMSYIQMKTAAEQFEQNKEIIQHTLAQYKNEYGQLYQFIKDTLLPKFEKTIQQFQNTSNQDSMFKLISIGTVTLQQLENIIKRCIDKINMYTQKTLFQNELEAENIEDQQEKGKKIEIPNNPFYFLKFTD